jgi:hypothetical protein
MLHINLSRFSAVAEAEEDYLSLIFTPMKCTSESRAIKRDDL